MKMRNKFGILALLIIISVILTGCENAFDEIFNPILIAEEVKNLEDSTIKEEDLFDTLDKTETIGLSDEEMDLEVLSDKVVLDSVTTLVNFVKKELNCEVDFFDYQQNYFNEFLGEEIDESADIVIIDGDFYPLYMSVFFRDSKPVNLLLTYNKLNIDNGKYFDFIEELYTVVGQNISMDNNEIEEIIYNLMNIEKYSENVYGNPEISGYLDNVFYLGVLFPEGKDFIFDGSTYYFSFYVNDYFVENES